ncbi:RluA family pseudouridine synthase [Myxococcota bacterium]|nr:RluA family pseudouridine synthase [Myxococcota bacterium]
MRLIDILRDRGLSRGDARRALTSGKVLLAGVPTADEGREVEDPALVELQPAAPRLHPGRDLVLVHRDPGFVVAWKPSGMLSVPAPREGGQKNALAMVRRICGAGLPVHRLDEETSGLILYALDEPMQLALKELLERHEIERGYLALVAQHFPRQAWSIESDLVRDRGDGLRGSRVVPAAPGRKPKARRLEPEPDQEVRHAVTHVSLVENLERDAALISARLETGRTHQVRIHLAEIGHPVLGDPLYAPRRVEARAPRLALHACRLAFTHPRTGQPVVVEAPLADDLEQLRRQLSARLDPKERDQQRKASRKAQAARKGWKKQGG